MRVVSGEECKNDGVADSSKADSRAVVLSACGRKKDAVASAALAPAARRKPLRVVEVVLAGMLRVA